MKPYHAIPIKDCGEPLVVIPPESFALVYPHPYQRLGAPYGHQSPYQLRAGVLRALQNAQGWLQRQQPRWRIQIFDAYRPIAVQQFMVNHTLEELRQRRYPNQASLSEDQHRTLMAEVIQFWAIPSNDPRTPPPHSTGAAVDICLVDATGDPIPMGSPIDEISERSWPDFFADKADPEAQRFHHHRQVLHQAMTTAGFCRHPKEWWHFSLGDQLWAWLQREANPSQPAIACYGRAEDGA
ncbi:D-alanyl-D-alanine dipeptidase [Leptolyngbya sp. BL0902]|uniref:M15 family metallopeptidase n=1 Tax=Leptolyngbya sp. BL0902 TaxID=1115757 RepID=UPI0018E6EF51|nr:M15 family metallopeptidase [Leptolyngbya sp. BL0902]QQE64087.1 D-alanyl-D-alanine dipeptidase [Leptolyngbya sp. BL0902]